METNTIELLKQLINEIKEQQTETGSSARELALVITKLEEAELWYSRVLELR